MKKQTKERKAYIAPCVSVTEIKTEDVIMTSTLQTATFFGAKIDAASVYIEVEG